MLLEKTITTPVVSIRGIFIVNIPISYFIFFTNPYNILLVLRLLLPYTKCTGSPPRAKYIGKGVILMDIIFCQPITNETISIVRERYTSLGWGEIYLRGNGNNVTELHFKWCKETSFMLPDVSDLGLSCPHRL